MKIRMLSIFSLIALALLISTVSNASEQDLSDEDLSKRQVGQWLCNDPTGKSEYTFKSNGTWFEEGTYFFKDGNQKVSLSGEWFIKDGYYYQKMTKSSMPHKIKLYDWFPTKIVKLDENENIVEFPDGEQHRHQRKK